MQLAAAGMLSQALAAAGGTGDRTRTSLQVRLASAAAWLCSQPCTLSLELRRSSWSLRVYVWVCHLHPSSLQLCIGAGGYPACSVCYRLRFGQQVLQRQTVLTLSAHSRLAA